MDQGTSDRATYQAIMADLVFVLVLVGVVGLLEETVDGGAEVTG